MLPLTDMAIPSARARPGPLEVSKAGPTFVAARGDRRSGADARSRVLTGLGLGLGALLLFGVALGARDLWNPNEPVYGQVVVEMAASGDWVLPTANGRLFAEKPVLYYWLALLASKALGGIDEFSLRVPSALAGTAGVVLVYLLASSYVDRRPAAIMAGCLATQYGYWFASRQMQMDVLLCVLVLATLLPLLRMLDHAARPTGAWALAGVAGGAGFLAKGPLALLLPALVLAGYLLVARRTPPVRSLEPAWIGLGLCLLLVAPWLVLLWRANPEAVLEMLLRQNLARFVQAWDHEQPWWYYLKYVWLEFAPWSWMAPLAIAVRARDPHEKRLIRLAWVWLGIVVVFFSLSESKRAPYLLPAAPAIAILAGLVLVRWQDGEKGPTLRRLAWGTICAIGLAMTAAGGLLALAGPRFLPQATTQLYACGIAMVATAALIALVLFRLRNRPPAALPLLSMAAFYLLLGVGVLPAANEIKSARDFGSTLEIRATQGEIASFGLLPQRAEYSFYSGVVVPNLTTDAELRAFWQRPGPCFVVVEQDDLGRAREALDGPTVVVAERIGSRNVYLLAESRAPRIEAEGG